MFGAPARRSRGYSDFSISISPRSSTVATDTRAMTAQPPFADAPEASFAGTTCGTRSPALAVMTAAIEIGNLWLLNFVHVLSSLLWTGVDLYMGFVLGPILRRLDLSVRRDIVDATDAAHAVPDADGVDHLRHHAAGSWRSMLGYAALPGRPIGWVAAALALVTLMTILGLGFLTPVNVMGLPRTAEARARPETDRRSGCSDTSTRSRRRALMQVAIIVVMTQVPHRHLIGLTIRPAPPPDAPARPRGPRAPSAGSRARPRPWPCPSGRRAAGGGRSGSPSRMSSSTSRRPGMPSPRGMRDLAHAVAVVDRDAVGRGAHVALGAGDDGDAEMRLVRRQRAAGRAIGEASRCASASRRRPAPARGARRRARSSSARRARRCRNAIRRNRNGRSRCRPARPRRRLRIAAAPRSLPSVGRAGSSTLACARTLRTSPPAEQPRGVDLVRHLVEQDAAALRGVELLRPARAVEEVGVVEAQDHAEPAELAARDDARASAAPPDRRRGCGRR